MGLTAFQAFRMVGAMDRHERLGHSVSGDSSSVESPVCRTSRTWWSLSRGAGGTGHVALQMAKFVYGVGSPAACGPTKDFAKRWVPIRWSTTRKPMLETPTMTALTSCSTITAHQVLQTGHCQDTLRRFLHLPAREGGQLSNSTKEGVRR